VYPHNHHLHSFPTRRSSDLSRTSETCFDCATAFDCREGATLKGILIVPSAFKSCNWLVSSTRSSCNSDPLGEHPTRANVKAKPAPVNAHSFFPLIQHPSP